MLRSLFSGISGLRAHQQMMDVTGNNIANVNSVGFKASQTVFEDTLSQTMRAAGAPQPGQGGTNPAQVGLGVRMSGITTNFAQGSAHSTGRATDLMISGDGFFVVKSVNEQLFTRAGAFNFDANGKLVTSTGAAVQGWSAVNGNINTNGQIGDIQLPVGTLIAPVATTNMVVSGNLPANAANATSIVRSITTYDSVGTAVTMSVNFTKTSATAWDVTVSDGTTTSTATNVAFNGSGQNPTPASLTFSGVTIDLAGITNYTGNTTVNPLSQNGAPAATLQSFSINPDGQLVGVFSNGLKQTVAQVAMSNFNNPPGLEKVGDSLYRFTVNSGLAQIGAAGTGGLGTIQSGTVEMSNVDLAQEFTNLIVAQRGFQANSKVISASDELLQDLVNLKR
jgi:flagellar hook protein FlgE